MRTITLNTAIAVYDNYLELPEHLKTIYTKAKEATQLAYAPYSSFNVGSALLLGDDTIVQGANQENAAYPSGLCAERVALFTASVQHKTEKVLAIAVTASSIIHNVNSPISPCGSCLQVMVETETKQGSPIEIVLFGEGSEIWVAPSAASLLPLRFSLTPR